MIKSKVEDKFKCTRFQRFCYSTKKKKQKKNSQNYNKEPTGLLEKIIYGILLIIN